jgi:chromosome segregation ATPase
MEAKIFEQERQLRDSTLELNKRDNKLIEVSNQVRMLATENERLLLMLREKEGKNKELNQESAEVDIDIKKLIEENSRLEVGMRNDQKKYDELKLQFSDIENKVCTEMGHKIRLLMNENDKINSVIGSKNSEIETWKTRYDEIETINRRKCETYELELRQFNQDNDKLRRDLNNSTEEICLFKDQVCDLERLVSDKKIDANKMERDYLDTISGLENLLKEERSHCDVTHQSLEDSHKKIHALTNELSDEQSWSGKLQTALDECKTKNNQLSIELDEESKRFQKTISALEESNSTITQLSSEHNELIHRLDQCNNDNRDLTETLDQANQDFKAMENLNGSLTLQIERMSKIDENQKEDIDGLKATINQQEALAVDLRCSIDHVNDCLQTEELECERLRGLLDERDLSLQEFNSELDTLLEAKIKVDAEVEEAHKTIQNLGADIVSKEEEISHEHWIQQKLQDDLTGAKTDIGDLGAQNQRLTATISSLNDAHQEYSEEKESEIDELQALLMQRDRTDFEKQQDMKARVLIRVVSSNARLMGMAFRQAWQHTVEDYQNDVRVYNKKQGIANRLCNSSVRLMSFGYNALKENYSQRRRGLESRLKFVIKSLTDRDALNLSKAYGSLKERKLMFDGVGFGDSAMKKIQL